MCNLICIFRVLETKSRWWNVNIVPSSFVIQMCIKTCTMSNILRISNSKPMQAESLSSKHQYINMYIFSIFASSWNIATSLFYSCQFPISSLTMKNFWLLSIFCDGLFVAKVYPGLAFWYWYHRWCKPQCEHVFPRFFYSLQVTLIEIDRYFT